jgi:hypothetical protein
MATNNMDSGDFFGNPRDRQRPGADDPEAAFYGMGAREPLHWVDADGVPDPREGTLSPFMYHDNAPIRRKRRHSLMPWIAIALILLLALPILKVVLTVLAVLSLVVVALVGLGVLALFLALFVSVFIMMRRFRMLSRRMYM